MLTRKWQFNLRTLLILSAIAPMLMALTYLVAPRMIAEIRLRRDVRNAQEWLERQTPPSQRWDFDKDAMKSSSSSNRRPPSDGPFLGGSILPNSHPKDARP